MACFWVSIWDTTVYTVYLTIYQSGGGYWWVFTEQGKYPPLATDTDTGEWLF